MFSVVSQSYNGDPRIWKMPEMRDIHEASHRHRVEGLTREAPCVTGNTVGQAGPFELTGTQMMSP